MEIEWYHLVVWYALGWAVFAKFICAMLGRFNINNAVAGILFAWVWPSILLAWLIILIEDDGISWWPGDKELFRCK